MSGHPIDHAGLEILPFSECLRLLASVPVGRVGFFTDGEIVILPVNHILDGQNPGLPHRVRVEAGRGRGSAPSRIRGRLL
jgi:hypothetical protein